MIRPLRGLVAIKADADAQMSAGGICIATIKEHLQQTGTVVSTGPGTTVDKKFISTVVTPGDRVLFTPGSAHTIKVDGEEYLMVDESNLFGVLGE